MTVIVNQSLYPVQAVERRFWHGNRYHAISAKVTLAYDEQGRLSEIHHIAPLDLDEVWYGRPMRSSLRRPGDLIPFKPTTDVLVVGTARPPGGRPHTQWDAALRFQGRQKRLRLYGPRTFRHSLLSGWSLSPPAPTSGVELRYENAFGGTSAEDKEELAEGEFYPDNPFGCGFIGRSRPDTSRDYPAPQIEAWNGVVTQLGKHVAVGGLGPIPGFFPDRARHMGSWAPGTAESASLGVPLDMDMHYWQCAPQDQLASEYLRHGDFVELEGLSTEAMKIAIPRVVATTLARYSDGHHKAQVMNLDTVLVDLDTRRLELRYHRIVPFDSDIQRILVDCAPVLRVGSEVSHG